MSIWDNHGAEARDKSGNTWTVWYVSKSPCESYGHHSRILYKYKLKSKSDEINVDSDYDPMQFFFIGIYDAIELNTPLKSTISAGAGAGYV